MSDLSRLDLEVSPTCDSRFCNLLATGSMRAVCGHHVALYCQAHLEQVSIDLLTHRVLCPKCFQPFSWDVIPQLYEVKK